MISHICYCSYSSYLACFFVIEYDYPEERLANFNSAKDELGSSHSEVFQKGLQNP